MTDKKQTNIELSEQTRKLFDAPWHVARVSTVETEEGIEIASLSTSTDAKRVARLPELYAALKEAAYEQCHACIEFSSEDGYVPDSSEFVEHGCPKKSKTCFCCKWWTLLKQVRDGR